MDRPVFVISVAAELAGMHPQTLRQYDRIGLVQPSRAPGKARRYSHAVTGKQGNHAAQINGFGVVEILYV